MQRFSKGENTFNGTVVFKYNDESYEAKVNAKANYYYQPCVMYFKDGTGQPEDDELEIESLEVESLRNEDTNTDCMEKYNSDENYKEEIDEAISDVLYESDKGKGKEEPEYDEDYYEEKTK